MIYGIVRPDLALAILGAGTLPVSLWLVDRALRMARAGAVGSGTPRRAALRWWLLPSVLLVLFLITFVAESVHHPSRALAAALEVAALAASSAYIWYRLRTLPRPRTS